MAADAGSQSGVVVVVAVVVEGAGKTACRRQLKSWGCLWLGPGSIVRMRGRVSTPETA